MMRTRKAGAAVKTVVTKAKAPKSAKLGNAAAVCDGAASPDVPATNPSPSPKAQEADPPVALAGAGARAAVLGAGERSAAQPGFGAHQLPPAQRQLPAQQVAGSTPKAIEAIERVIGRALEPLKTSLASVASGLAAPRDRAPEPPRLAALAPAAVVAPLPAPTNQAVTVVGPAAAPEPTVAAAPQPAPAVSAVNLAITVNEALADERAANMSAAEEAAAAFSRAVGADGNASATTSFLAKQQLVADVNRQLATAARLADAANDGPLLRKVLLYTYKRMLLISGAYDHVGPQSDGRGPSAALDYIIVVLPKVASLSAKELESPIKRYIEPVLEQYKAKSKEDGDKGKGKGGSGGGGGSGNFGSSKGFGGRGRDDYRDRERDDRRSSYGRDNKRQRGSY